MVRRILLCLLLTVPLNAASITLTIPDAIAQQVLDDFCAANGYTGGAETKMAFMKRKIGEYVKATVINYEAKIAQQNADTAARSSGDSLINIQ